MVSVRGQTGFDRGRRLPPRLHTLVPPVSVVNRTRLAAEGYGESPVTESLGTVLSVSLVSSIPTTQQAQHSGDTDGDSTSREVLHARSTRTECRGTRPRGR